MPKKKAKRAEAGEKQEIQSLIERYVGKLNEARQRRSRWQEEEEKYQGVVLSLKRLLGDKPKEKKKSNSEERPAMQAAAKEEGRVSLRGLIVPILREAQKPLHVAEIWRLAEAKGARSKLYGTHAVHYALADLSKKQQPIEKVGPGTWRYKEK